GVAVDRPGAPKPDARLVKRSAPAVGVSLLKQEHGLHQRPQKLVVTIEILPGDEPEPFARRAGVGRQGLVKRQPEVMPRHGVIPGLERDGLAADAARFVSATPTA